MSFDQFLTWIIEGVLGGSAIYGVKILGDLKKSIDGLSLQVATIIEKTVWMEKHLDNHEDRLSDLEK